MIVVYIIAGLLIAIMVIAALLPAKYNVEQSIIIRRTSGEVMDKVGDFNTFSRWNPWQHRTKDAYTITGAPRTVGHQYAWDSKKSGKGFYTLTGIDARHIHFKLEFLRPWKASAKDNWLFEDWGSHETKVTWQNAGDLPYPIGRLIGAAMNKNLQKEFTQGLNNLKQLCEGGKA